METTPHTLTAVKTPPRTVPCAKPGSAPTTPGDSQRRGTLRNVLELRLGALATSLDKSEMMMMGRCGGGGGRDLKGEDAGDCVVGVGSRVGGRRSRDGEQGCAGGPRDEEVEEEEEEKEMREDEQGRARRERLREESDSAIEGLIFCADGEVDLSALMC